MPDVDDLRGDERRTVQPGRRHADEEREVIATAVAEEVDRVRDEMRHRDRRSKLQWLVVWLLTLVMSFFAWRTADTANSRANRVADDANHNADVARAQTRQACLRSKRLLPYLTQALVNASDMEQHPEDFRAYKSLTAKHC